MWFIKRNSEPIELTILNEEIAPKIGLFRLWKARYAPEGVKNTSFNYLERFCGVLGLKLIPVRNLRVGAGAIFESTIYLNIDTVLPWFYVLGHEVGHDLHNAGMLFELFSITFEHLIDYEGAEKYLESLDSPTKSCKGCPYHKLKHIPEVIADAMGEFWLQPEFWNVVRDGASDQVYSLTELVDTIIAHQPGSVDEAETVLGFFKEVDIMRNSFASTLQKYLKLRIESL